MSNMSPQSPIFRSNDTDEELAQKGIFLVCISFLTIIWCFASYFIVLIKGWGLEVQSWGWMFFIWFVLIAVGVLKDIAIKIIKKID